MAKDIEHNQGAPNVRIIATDRTNDSSRHAYCRDGQVLRCALRDALSGGGSVWHNAVSRHIGRDPLVICPNEIAGVEAKQSRHQLTLRVADLLGLLQLVEIAGGGVHTAAAESVVSAILRDPDGNTIEVIQA